MNIQDYVPTPSAPARPGFDFAGWTDPAVALPVLAAFLVLMALAMLVVVIAVVATQPNNRRRPRPPIESTP